MVTTHHKTPEQIAERLTMRFWPSFSSEYTAEFEVAERKSGVRTEYTTYAVKEDKPLPSGTRVFRVRKQGMMPNDWYEVHLAADGKCLCSCKSGQCRAGKPCRHTLACQFLIEEGVF